MGKGNGSTRMKTSNNGGGKYSYDDVIADIKKAKTAKELDAIEEKVSKNLANYDDSELEKMSDASTERHNEIASQINKQKQSAQSRSSNKDSDRISTSSKGQVTYKSTPIEGNDGSYKDTHTFEYYDSKLGYVQDTLRSFSIKVNGKSLREGDFVQERVSNYRVGANYKNAPTSYATKVTYELLEDSKWTYFDSKAKLESYLKKKYK